MKKNPPQEFHLAEPAAAAAAAAELNATKKKT